MAHVMIVVGHPRTGTYADALADAYAKGAEAAQHKVDVFRAAEMSFDPILREAYEAPQPREPDLEALYQTLMACDHIVVVYPIWLGTMPALLKGLLERCFQPELVAHGKEGQFPKPLKGKSVRLIATSGMPALLYRWWFGAPSLKILENHIFGFLGAAPVRTTLHGRIEAVGDAQRRSWLEEMERLGSQAR